MIEYLNRETVMKELDRNSITKKITFSDGVSIYDSIQKLPTADVVEVVRCKDCKHSEETEPVFGITDYECKKLKVQCLSACDFCSYGERRCE